MSGDPESEVQAIFISNYVHVFSITILFYDHLLTFDDEHRFIWRPSKNFSSYCFFLNRYVALFGNSSVLVSSFHPLSSTACRKFQLWRQILLFWNQLLCVVLLMLRVYALYERSRKVLTFLIALVAFLFGLASWALTGEHAKAGHPELGCHLANPDSTNARIALPWEALFAYDLSIVFFIVYKSFRTYSALALRRRPALLHVILRDGVTYFLVMSLTNMGNAWTYYFAKDPFLKGCLTTFSGTFSVTLVSRLMLNLHKANPSGIMSTVETTSSATRVSPDQEGIELDTLYTASRATGGMGGDVFDYTESSSISHRPNR